MLSLFLFAFALFPLAWAQTCYFPDGSVSPNDSPCPRADGDAQSACCGTQVDGSRATCLSNNLCMADMKISRGSCTDHSWNDFACPHYCLTVSALNGGLVLNSCGGPQLWSCGDCATSNFTIPSSTFRFSAAQLVALGASVSGNETASSTITSATTASTATKSGSASSTAVVVTSTTAGSPSHTTASSQADGSTTSSSPDNSVTCSPEKQGGSNATVVGAAVGVSLGALLLTVAGLLVHERRKNILLRRQLGPGPMHTQGHAPDVISSPISSLGPDKPLPSYMQAYNKPQQPPPPPPPGYRNDSNNIFTTNNHQVDRWRSMQQQQQHQHQLMTQNNNRPRPSTGMVNELDGSSPSEMASPLDFKCGSL